LLSRSLGDAAGLCGMAMFSLVMILSARLKFFEKFFKGINESYTAHHFFGGLAFCLLLFHPLLLAYRYFLISYKAAALFLLPSTSLALNFGILGLFVMIITLVLTFYTKLKYQVWKFTHKFLGVAFIFAFLHTFLIGADVATNQPLRIYLFVLGIGAIVAYFYRTLFADYLVRIFDYKVTGIKEYEDKIWEITFQPKNREIKFTPGQFAFVKLFSNEISKEPHPFSFSSANGSPLKIAIKELGDYTNKIGKIREGDLAVFEGPFGAFSFRNYQNKKQIWIAGGVGITPFLSMLRDLTDKDSDYIIDIYYSVKDESCLAFKSEIELIAKNNKNLNVIFWVTNKEGFINGDYITEKIPDLKDRDILICGPGIMMSALKDQLFNKGLAKNQIHAEEFQLY
jgi:predicted ferric reductase